MLQSQPVKTYRGTWDELMSHRSEIAPGAMLEIRVYEPEAAPTVDTNPIVEAKLTAENDQTIALLESWLREDATDDPTELEAAAQELNEFKRTLNQTRKEAGARLLYPEVE